MFNYEIGTPCPAPAHGGREVASPFGSKQNNIFDDAFDQFNDNTTQNIAHLVQQEFKNAPPRRTQNLARKPRRAPTTIFEDASSSSQREPYRRDEPAGMMRSSAIHARPAQRIRIQASREEKPASLPTSSSTDIANFKPNISTNKPVNEDRRRTIWIPEDTTLLSIHPGAYDHTLHDETVGLPSSQLDITPMKETPQPVRMGASAMRQAQKMASTSKRSALRPLAPSQPNVSNSVMGTGGGKENVLPGALLSRNTKGEKPLVKSMSKAAPLGTSRSQPSLQQTTIVKKRPAPELKDAPKPKVQARALHERSSVRSEVLPRPANLDPFSRDFKHKPLPAPKQAASKPPSARPVSQTFAPKDVNTRPVSSTIPPRDVSLPNLKRSVFLAASRYPVLSDDLGQPELYEDNWLQNQEVALTQLVNVVFQQAHESSAANDVAALRGRMLMLYHDASVATLHQRLKASLSCGALSMPKDSSQSPKLRDDIGLRRQFFDLFGHTYDSEALQAAAEVVVGRIITPAADHAQSRAAASSSTGIKEWKRFCSTFFVDHEDSAELMTAHDNKASEGSTAQPGTPEWFWQRTVLRGLMLIHLLDQVKSTGKLSICLFQASSPHKSSISVLRAFAKLMVPSVGDISRPLGHLGYSVRHVQQQLEEYTYRIDNLAVDLRDGVLLAHFVELLLYPSQNLDDRSDRAITLDLPDGETLTSFLDTNSTAHILSQHLKFPCNSKVQKMHNVQVALSALAGARGLAGTAIETIKGEDIVNGHREKTLSLLWALVSRWGLGYLVDWDELKKETLRFSKLSTQPVGINYALSEEQPDTNEQGPLLKEWAASVCQQHKVIVTNLTTSFADGRALAAIISTYADYVPTSTKKSSNKMSTADRLRNLGCSESFITLFASQATTIPSRSNTIALLAFLASRLLPLARTHRAACTIQNAYRLRLARRNISLRIQKMRAATDCAAVAANKQREIDAAVTLQRAWRAVLDRRIECLERDVLAFQSMARGWAIRRATAGVLGTGSGRRVMGGW